MKIALDGRFSARVAVVMGIAAGTWHLGVRSLHQGLSEARAGSLAAQQEIQLHEARFAAEPASADGAIATFKQRESAILERSAKSADAGKIYESLGAIASATNVRIDRIEPARGPVRDTHLRTSAPGGATCDAVGYSIEATGEYAQLVAFADAVQSDLGMTKILSIRIGPAGSTAESRTMLAASIETAHFKLVAGPAQNPEKQGGK